MGTKLEIEPLSDARWARIEESLMQRLDELPPAAPPIPARPPSSRVRTVAFVGSFAVAAAAAVFAVRVMSPSAHATSRVVTEASASHVTIGENSIDLSPESGIVVDDGERATVLTLERGEVALHVAPRPKDRPFLVEAGDVHVRVVGTEFTVRRVGIGATVSVRKGIVEVREHDELTRLTAGEHWPEEAKPATGTSNPTAAATPTPTAAPASNAAPTATATPTANPTPVAVRSPVRHARPSTATPPPAAAPADDLPATPPPAAPAPPTAQERFEAAEQLERKDPASALRAYVSLAQGSDAWAQNALYAAGRLQVDRGQRADAARLLEEYLRRFPRGSNAQDARALRESLR